MDMNYRGGLWEGGDGQDGVEWGGGKWDNCNSIINKYIKKIKLSLFANTVTVYMETFFLNLKLMRQSNERV